MTNRLKCFQRRSADPGAFVSTTQPLLEMENNRRLRLRVAVPEALTGLLADQFGIQASVVVVGLLTMSSALLIQYRMYCPNTVLVSADLSPVALD